MMKMNILKNGFQALIIVSLMAACSLGEVLEPSDGVNMALMETVDTVVAIPGDTISFKFIASTNTGTDGGRRGVFISSRLDCDDDLSRYRT